MDRLTKAARSALMSRIRSVSSLELAARPVAESTAGVRLRHQPAGIMGKPDYANKARKTAVFVHGCFWHAHGHCRIPKTNRAFWRRKMSRNVERHKEVVSALRRGRWKVLTIWECDVRRILREGRAKAPSIRHSRGILTRDGRGFTS